MMITETLPLGQGPPPGATYIASAEGDDHQAIIRVLQQHDIPAMFWSACERFYHTGEIIGAEFRARVATLGQFAECLDELQVLRATL